MNQEINIAPNTDVLSFIGLGNRPSVAGATLLTDMKMIEDLGMQYATQKSKQKTHFAIYECPYCGKHFRGYYYYIQQYKSCGCYKDIVFVNRNRRHDLARHPLYVAWTHIKQRCRNKNDKGYKNYGGRGIDVCDDWYNNFISFYNWCITNGYKSGLQIDRVDNDGNYEPDNCRWVERFVNIQNKRPPHNQTGYKGVYIRSWTGKRGITRVLFVSRIKNNGVLYRLGGFKTAKEAALAYNNFVITNHTNHTLNKI